MQDRIVAKDRGTGLMLVRDEQDPPRFYLRRNGRRELISIGDAASALRQFSRDVRRLKSLHPQRPAVARSNVIQFPHPMQWPTNAVGPMGESSHAA